MGTYFPGRSSVPEAHHRWLLVDGVALLLAVACFASALFLALAMFCAIPLLYFSTSSSDWLWETVRRFTEVPGEITRWLGLVTVRCTLPGGLGLLIARRGRRAPPGLDIGERASGSRSGACAPTGF